MTRSRTVISGLFILTGLLAAGSARSGPLEGPAIQFEYREVDLGVMPQISKRDTVFTFKNLGSEDLRILDVKTSCGCTAALASESVIPPGATGSINVKFDSKTFTGHVTKTITVHSNDPGEPESQLTLRAQVEPMVVLGPERIELGLVRLGEKIHRSVRIGARKDKGLKILGVEGPETHFRWEITTVAHPDSDVYVIGLDLLDDAPLGSLSERLAIQTNLEDLKPLPVHLRGEIVRDFRAEPSTLNFGSFRAGMVSPAVVVIKPVGGTLYAVESVETSHPLIRARLEETDLKGIYKVHVTVDPALPPGRLSARLIINTNDPEEPVFTVPIQGYVRSQS